MRRITIYPSPTAAHQAWWGRDVDWTGGLRVLSGGLVNRTIRSLVDGLPWPVGGARALAEAVEWQPGDAVAIELPCGYDGQAVEAVRGLEVEFERLSLAAVVSP